MAEAQARADFQSNNIHAQGAVYFNTTSNNTHTHIHSPPPAVKHSYVNPQLLINACRDGNAHLVQELLNHIHPGDVNYADTTDDNNTALHLAAKANDVTLAKVLLGDRLIDVNAKNKQTETSLYVAAKVGHDAVVALLLLSPGINVNLCTTEVEWHRNAALHAATRAGHTTVVQLLLHNANIDVNVRNESDWTPLMIACCDGRTQIVHELLAHPNIDVNAVGVMDSTALHAPLVPGFSRPPVVKALLGHPDINPNLRDKCGWTPLMYASQQSVKDTVQQLLDYPGIDVNVRDKEGRTALSEANDKEIRQMLLDRGAVLYDKDSECCIS